MAIAMDGTTEWCILRHRNYYGFDVVKRGYKSQENAQKGLPVIANKLKRELGGVNATYAVGRIAISAPVVVTAFHAY